MRYKKSILMSILLSWSFSTFAQTTASTICNRADSLLSQIFQEVDSLLGYYNLPQGWFPLEDSCFHEWRWSGYYVDHTHQVQWTKPCITSDVVVQFSEVLPSTEEQFRFRLLVYPLMREATLSFWVPQGRSGIIKYKDEIWYWSNRVKNPFPPEGVTVLETVVSSLSK